MPGGTLNAAGEVSTRPATAPLPTLPGYAIEREIGSGGMGVVYKATHLALARPVALKLLRAGELAKPDDRQRFLQEAELVARLRHPNIVQVYDVGVADGRCFFTMELIAGSTLAERCGAATLPDREAARLVLAVARAADHAHRQGVIHRDLKPANILMTEDGTPKLVDFGVAKNLELDETITKTGNLIGTPSYMAPEQASAAKAIGPATDVYAIGAILYKLLTGRAVFEGDHLYDVLHEIVNTEPVPPTRLRADIPRDLEAICLKCLQKNAAERYTTAAALADDLERYLNDQPILARRTPPWRWLLKWCRRNPAASLGIGLSIIGVAGLVVGLSVFANQQARHAEELRKERDRIRTERDQAAEANRGLIRTIDAAFSGRPFDRQELESLDRAVAFFDRDGVPPDAEGRFQLAMALRFRGRLPHDARGPNQPLLPEEEAAYRRSVELFAGLEGDATYGEAARLAGANTRNNLGNASRSRSAWAEARDWFEQSISGLEKLHREFPHKPEYGLYLANALRNWALGEVLAGNASDAVALRLREAIELHKAGLAKMTNPTARFRTWQSEAYQTLVALHELQGDAPKLRDAVGEWVAASGAQPAVRLQAAMALARAHGRWNQIEDANLAIKWLTLLSDLGLLTTTDLTNPSFNSLKSLPAFRSLLLRR